MPRRLALALFTILGLIGLAQLAPATAQVVPSNLYLPVLAAPPPSPTATATSTATATAQPTATATSTATSTVTSQSTATATATATTQPTATNTSQPAPNCHPSYPTVCIPPPPPDLNCGDISFRRFTVIGSDPHNFDTDNDGIGCESG